MRKYTYLPGVLVLLKSSQIQLSVSGTFLHRIIAHTRQVDTESVRNNPVQESARDRHLNFVQNFRVVPYYLEMGTH